MSDFFRGVGIGLAGIGNGTNGIARAVNNFALAPYITAIKAQQARSAAALQALNEAKLQDIQNRRTANSYWAQQTGVPVEALNGYSPSEGEQLMKNVRIGQMMQAAGMLQPRGDGLDDIRANVNNSIARDAVALRRLAQDSDLIARSADGRGIYQYQNNGAAFDPSYGTSNIADPEVRNLYRQKAQADITKSRTQAAKAARSGGGSSNAGWQIKETEDGETVRVNARTGEIVPLDKKLKFGRRNTDKYGSLEDDNDPELDMAREAIKAGKSYDKVAARYKVRTGKDFPG